MKNPLVYTECHSDDVSRVMSSHDDINHTLYIHRIDYSPSYNFIQLIPHICYPEAPTD